MAKPVGWKKEPARHALAAKGVKTCERQGHDHSLDHLAAARAARRFQRDMPRLNAPELRPPNAEYAHFVKCWYTINPDEDRIEVVELPWEDSIQRSVSRSFLRRLQASKYYGVYENVDDAQKALNVAHEEMSQF